MSYSNLKATIESGNITASKLLDLGCGILSSLVELVKGQSGQYLNKIVAVDDDKLGSIQEYYGVPFRDLKDHKHLLSKREDLNAEEISRVALIEPICSSIQSYLSSTPEKFDLIIISNVLHFELNQTARKDILTNAREILSPDGVIYLRVASHNHHYKEDLNKITFNIESQKAEARQCRLSPLFPLQWENDKANLSGYFKYK